MYTNGQIITNKEHVAFANWNNANGRKFRSESLGDGTYKITEIVIPELTIEEQNEIISQTREALYAKHIDKLHSQKNRKVTCGTWTEELEAEYVAKVKELSEKIQNENPYIE